MDDQNEKSSARLRNGSFLSWLMLRDILVILFLVILSWKLLTADIVINLEQFGFSDLLSVLLAFFAIALSAAFYFKATETSNRFYDNVYKFTKDTSEMLGRIETGFGERLRHLDEGYAGLVNRFDRIPFDLDKAKHEAQKESLEIEQKEKEHQQILEELTNRAKLQHQEKEIFLSKLAKSEEDLRRAREELARLQTTIQDAENFDDVDEKLVQYLRHRLGSLSHSRYAEAPSSILKSRFKTIKQRLHEDAVSDMKARGYLDEEENLTITGIDFLRKTIRKGI